jgi:Heparinase II/III-like protein/Heparinase II/III N-terminus
LSSPRLGWYLARLRRMSAGEMAWRLRDTVEHALWARRQVIPGSPLNAPILRSGPAVAAVIPAGAADKIPDVARDALLGAADALLEGRLTLLGVERRDLSSPDWFYDPVTERRAPRTEYAFGIDHRSEEVTGNVKQIWELSRLQHLTLLAAAWNVTGNDAYAKATDEQLMSWWKENPFLSGINWTSGIEIGIRLISFVWIRRLLEGWYGAPGLFEENDLAVAQVRWHQEYLSAFRSRGSSANNHVIAEAAGQLVASCAFPWFKESDRWRNEAADLLQRELRLNTFASGLNREQASDYHGFVVELGLLAAVEADACGHPLDAATWELLARMLDCGAAVLDCALQPPRQGDSDEGRALVLDDPEANRWSTLIATGAALVGPAPWWPRAPESVTSTLVASIASARAPVVRDSDGIRPSHFSDGGLTLLRTRPATEPEIWCRCDGGPHGFLSIAGHAHADALSVEVRHGGVGILVDPGTYCYHGDPEFRRYFRSTLAHNTVELAGRDQSISGGPFLWLRHAHTSGVEVGYLPDGEIARWSARHDGYESLDHPADHHRTVTLDAGSGRIDVYDEITTAGPNRAKLVFHLGPTVSCILHANRAELTWEAGPEDGVWFAVLDLPDRVAWSEHRGESEPLLGWYSSSFGSIEPTTVLMGELECGTGKTRLHTAVQFQNRVRKARSEAR